MDNLVSQGLEDLLRDYCSSRTVRAIEHGASPDPLWARLEGSGFADAMVPEREGGAGLAWHEALPLLELCGGYVVPVPLAHTMIARQLLAAANLTRPPGSIAIGSGTIDAAGNLCCANVALGKVAERVLAVADDGGILLLPTAQANVSDGVFALDATMVWDAASVAASRCCATAPDLQLPEACAAAAQISGARTSVLQRTLQHANEREQFGRPIGKFQAVQHQISVMAEQVFAARMAVQIGCRSESVVLDRRRVAVAKARTSEAALEAAALAHAIHGAIGFTEEFDLQLYTRRLHHWRQTAGSETYWHEVLGAAWVDSDVGLSLDLVRAITDVSFA
jgi:acyl-CoA dehydrogenase